MKTIFFSVFLLATYALHAQTTNITLSKEFSLRDRGLTQKDGATFKAGDFYFCTETDYKGMQFAYTAKLDKVKYGINVYKYDQDMKELQKISLDKDGKSFGPFPPKALYFGGKILVFYYTVQEKGAIQLQYAVIDPESFTPSPAKVIYTISEKNVGAFNLAKVYENNKLLFYISPDSSSLLVSQVGNTNEFFSCIIGKNMEPSRSLISRIKGNMENFTFDQTGIDNAGNKYFTYTYTEDKLSRHGIIVQNSNGKEAYLTFRSMQDGTEAGFLFLKISKDSGKVYVFGPTVGEYLEEGVVLATVDPVGLKLGKPLVCPYPEDLKVRLHRMDYAIKKHGKISVKRAYYLCNELDDGTVVLTGYPINFVIHEHQDLMNKNFMGTPTIDHYAGPIINIFIKGGKSHLGVIYRNQEMTSASPVIVIPYKDKVVCIYNDSKKSLSSDNPNVIDRKWEAYELVLAEAVINSDGTVVSRKSLTEKPGAPQYFTQYQQQLGGNTHLVPIARDKMNLMRYYTEIVQWATITVN